MVDVDGVVVTSPDGRLWSWNAKADIGLDPDLLQSRFFGPHWADVVLGRADLHERLGPVLAEIAPHLTSQQVATYWFTRDAHLDKRLLADLAELRKTNISLHLATAQEHHRAKYLWQTLGLRDQFDAMHYAADLGCSKPDPAFYREIERRTGYAPSDLMLIDDRLDNVESAIAGGWQAVLWDGTQGLLDILGLSR